MKSEPETQPQAAAEPAPDAPPETAAPADEFQPFRLNEQPIPDALVDTNGDVFIPKESVAAITDLVSKSQAAAQHYQKLWQDDRAAIGRQVAEAKREGQETLSRAHALMQRMDEVFATGDPNAILDFAQNWLVNKPRIEAETRAKLAEQRLNELNTQESQRQTKEQEAAVRPLKEAAVDEWTEKLARARGFTDADMADLKARYRGWGDRLFAVENGETVIVYRDIDADLAYLAKLRGTSSAAPRPATPPPPPVVATRSAPSAKPAKKPEVNPRASTRDRDAETFRDAFK